MENLHNDILENILLRLPIEAALYAKRVCATWRSILRCKTDKQGFLFKSCHKDCRSPANPVRKELFYANVYDQAKMKYYYPPNKPSVLVGSCNGLVCFGKYDKFDIGTIPFLICNPLTGESMVLPINYSEFPRDISNTGRNYCGRLSSGFGYCPSTNEYKVVTMYHSFREGHKAHVQVYRVGGEWRYIGFIDRYKRYRYVCCPGIYANGVLYWLYISDPVVVQECEIVAFNLEGETFDNIPLPGLNYKDFEIPTFVCPLKLLGGNNNLYLVHTYRKASGSTDICVYKKNNISTGGRKLNNQSESSSDWIKEFSIQREEKAELIPLAITTRNDILLWYKLCAPFGKRLCCYDPKTSTLNELWDDDKAYSIDAVPHRHTIVSLKDLGVKNVTSLKDL